MHAVLFSQAYAVVMYITLRKVAVMLISLHVVASDANMIAGYRNLTVRIIVTRTGQSNQCIITIDEGKVSL